MVVNRVWQQAIRSVSADPTRDAFISALRNNDGELLRRLLEILGRDNSIEAKRLATTLIQEPELRDLIAAGEGLSSCHDASKPR